MPAAARHQPATGYRGRHGAEKRFKSYPIGFFHIDIAEVQTAEGKLYPFVAIDRTGKFAFVQLVESANRVTASVFLVALIAAVPYRIHTILNDDGIQFRFPPRYANGPTARYITYMFAMHCRENGIEHRFTRINQDPERPHTLRVHLQALDFRARTIQARSDPTNAGTEHADLGRSVQSSPAAGAYRQQPAGRS